MILEVSGAEPRLVYQLVRKIFEFRTGAREKGLLKFDRDARTNETVRENLKHLYGIVDAPCDTALRERLDEVDPAALGGAFKRVFALPRRGKGLEGFGWLDHYLLSVDGTGYFSSSRVHCKRCCEKRYWNGEVAYYRQMLGAVLVHPEQREVFPLAPEPTEKGDGARKNDCERNAAKRLLTRVRREHPHLKLLVVEDALASNGPHIRLLRSFDMRFVLGVKSGDHEHLFAWVDATGGTRTFATTGTDGVVRRYRYLNGVPLNDANFDLEVNFLECRETRPGKRERCFFPGHRSYGHRGERGGSDAGRTRPLAYRERDFQHPGEPRLRLRAQLRPRRQPSGDGVRATDDAGLSHRPGATEKLPVVSSGAGQGGKGAVLSGRSAEFGKKLSLA